jgi:hypothetical protein
MVSVPAVVWRGGFAARALTIGVPVGLCLGALAWLDSGLLLSGVIVAVVTGTVLGVWMARRMSRFWPDAAALSGDDRVAVVRAARTGADVGARLAGPRAEYVRGLGRRLRLLEQCDRLGRLSRRAAGRAVLVAATAGSAGLARRTGHPPVGWEHRASDQC